MPKMLHDRPFQRLHAVPARGGSIANTKGPTTAKDNKRCGRRLPTFFGRRCDCVTTALVQIWCMMCLRCRSVALDGGLGARGAACPVAILGPNGMGVPRSGIALPSRAVQIPIRAFPASWDCVKGGRPSRPHPSCANNVVNWQGPAGILFWLAGAWRMTDYTMVIRSMDEVIGSWLRHSPTLPCPARSPVSQWRGRLRRLIPNFYGRKASVPRLAPR